jgi:hypothetical protein
MLPEPGSPSSRAATDCPMLLGEVAELSSGPRVHVESNVNWPVCALLKKPSASWWTRYSNPVRIECAPAAFVSVEATVWLFTGRFSPVKPLLIYPVRLMRGKRAMSAGTNQLHGTARYQFYRPDLWANDWFNNFAGRPKNPFSLDTWGGSLLGARYERGINNPPDPISGPAAIGVAARPKSSGETHRRL